MKTLRLAGWLLSAAVLAGGLAACSDDDDADDDGSGNSGNSGNTGKLEWVDLGLSVKWASCNLGANHPWDYGDYYAWGETEKPAGDDYSVSNCFAWGKGLAALRSAGYIDGNDNLTAEHDVATVKLGSGAHMPTYAQIQELIDECTTVWVENYNGTGVNGRLVTSKKNKNTIFFPAAGYRYGTSLNNAGSYGLYWSATAYDGSYYAGTSTSFRATSPGATTSAATVFPSVRSQNKFDYLIHLTI